MTMHCSCNVRDSECSYPKCHNGEQQKERTHLVNAYVQLLLSTESGEIDTIEWADMTRGLRHKLTASERESAMNRARATLEERK